MEEKHTYGVNITCPYCFAQVQNTAVIAKDVEVGEGEEMTCAACSGVFTYQKIDDKSYKTFKTT